MTSVKVTVMKDAKDLIAEAVDQLRRQRDEIDVQIVILMDTITKLEAGKGSVLAGHSFNSPPTITLGSIGAPPRSIRAVALGLRDTSSTGVFSLGELMTALGEEGSDAARASVSSVVSRLKAEGELEAGPRRGTYRRPIERSIAKPSPPPFDTHEEEGGDDVNSTATGAVSTTG